MTKTTRKKTGRTSIATTALSIVRRRLQRLTTAMTKAASNKRTESEARAATAMLATTLSDAPSQRIPKVAKEIAKAQPHVATTSGEMRFIVSSPTPLLKRRVS
jgi:hypothetical protein